MHSSDFQAKQGFTLVEILAAVAVMALMLVALSTMLSGSVKYAEIGTQNVVEASRGRSFIEQLSRELSMAVVDDQITLKLESDTSGGSPDADRLQFVSLNADSDSTPGRSARQLRYEIRDSDDTMNNAEATSTPVRRQVWANRKNNQTATGYECYTSDTWWANAEWALNTGDYLALDYVRTFEIWIYNKTELDKANPATLLNYDSSTDGIPVYAEIYIEVLSPDAALKASFMSGAVKESYESRMAQRFFRRVYFENRIGYNNG